MMKTIACLGAALLLATLCGAQPSTTPKWKVHDMERPWPPRAEPKPAADLAAAARPPAHAIVLFDGTNLDRWQPGRWKIEAGYVEVVPKAGDLVTRDAFGSCHLHLEWRTPAPVEGDGQNRGNSGVYLMGRYEVQVLDNTDNKTYADGIAAAAYGQNPPLFDACRPSGEWNFYDIFFRAPVFGPDGKVVRTAAVTVVFNGIVVQDNFEYRGTSGHNKPGAYEAHPAKVPLALQEHNERVRYRNIWIVPLED